MGTLNGSTFELKLSGVATRGMAKHVMTRIQQRGSTTLSYVAHAMSLLFDTLNKSTSNRTIELVE